MAEINYPHTIQGFSVPLVVAAQELNPLNVDGLTTQLNLTVSNPLSRVVNLTLTATATGGHAAKVQTITLSPTGIYSLAADEQDKPLVVDITLNSKFPVGQGALITVLGTEV